MGVRQVRELYGVLHDRGASAAKLVATTSFTPDAIAFAEKKPIELVDSNASLTSDSKLFRLLGGSCTTSTTGIRSSHAGLSRLWRGHEAANCETRPQIQDRSSGAAQIILNVTVLGIFELTVLCAALSVLDFAWMIFLPITYGAGNGHAARICGFVVSCQFFGRAVGY